MSSTFLNEGVLRSLFFLHLLLRLLLYRFARNEFSVYQYTKMCRYILLLEMRDLDQIKRYNLMSIYTPYFAIFLFIKKRYNQKHISVHIVHPIKRHTHECLHIDMNNEYNTIR